MLILSSAKPNSEEKEKFCFKFFSNEKQWVYKCYKNLITDFL